MEIPDNYCLCVFCRCYFPGKASGGDTCKPCGDALDDHLARQQKFEDRHARDAALARYRAGEIPRA